MFDFFDPLVEICARRGYRLIIKPHPYLYNKYSYEQSGGIDWRKKIEDSRSICENIVFLSGKQADLGQYFAMTDVFVTDVSGLGFEFVSATSRPIVFLGNKLKIPLEDLRKGNIDKYRDCPEIYYRGKIGPVVDSPEDLEATITGILTEDAYSEQRQQYCQEFIPNVGTATSVVVSHIEELLGEMGNKKGASKVQ
jgi:CDP-glycerol glycerophosphotransferase (TagB/SpsB family)